MLRRLSFKLFQSLYFDLHPLANPHKIHVYPNGLIGICDFIFIFKGRPEPTVTWMNGLVPIHTGGGVSMGRHVTVNRLEVPKVTRDALNTTFKCQASNTRQVPPVERSVRLDMLCKLLQNW